MVSLLTRENGSDTWNVRISIKTQNYYSKGQPSWENIKKNPNTSLTMAYDTWTATSLPPTLQRDGLEPSGARQRTSGPDGGVIATNCVTRRRRQGSSILLRRPDMTATFFCHGSPVPVAPDVSRKLISETGRPCAFGSLFSSRRAAIPLIIIVITTTAITAP